MQALNGCANPAPGRVECHADVVRNGVGETVVFQPVFVVPADFPLFAVTFKATVTAREAEANLENNLATFSFNVGDTVAVTTTADSGAGSLRQAVLDVNATCKGRTPCTIAFRIAEASDTRWKTIRLVSPLPRITGERLRIDGTTQTAFAGDTNPDGPEIEIAGGGTVDGDGLLVAACNAQVSGLAINGFKGNGVSILGATGCNAAGALARIDNLYAGTDPTGTIARPNFRGIGAAMPNGHTVFQLQSLIEVRDSVVSGNVRSGIYVLSGRLNVFNSRIGVQARADEPLPNGGAGIYVGSGGYGAQIGGGTTQNVIAFNREMGVAVDATVGDVSIEGNRIFGNRGLAIDVGLDGPTPSSPVSPPVLTLAHYDPVADETVIEGDDLGPQRSTFTNRVELFADDATDSSGYAQARRRLGFISFGGPVPAHFRATVKGDLTGQFITAAATRTNYVGFEAAGVKPSGIEQLFLTQTSELSRAIEVR